MTLESFAQGYFFAWIFWSGLSIGCTALMFLYHSIRPRWGIAILRVLEAGWRTLPIPFVGGLLVMIAAANHWLYPWADPALRNNHYVAHRWPWMSLPWFAARYVVYFAFWYFWALRLVNSVRRQERNGDLRETQFRADWATPGLVLHALIVTMAFTDWVMSLSPDWYSTIFGLWFMISQGLSAIAFSVIFVTWLKNNGREPFATMVDKPLLRDLGNIMLTLVMFWGYFSISQVLIIWSGNLSDENRFYAFRMSPAWNPVGTFIYTAGFFGSFLLLIYNGTKRNSRSLFGAAVFVLFVRMVDIYWTVVPFFNRNVTILPNVDIGPATILAQSAIGFIVLGAIWLLFFNMAWKSNTPLPTYDPRVSLEPGAQEAHGHA